MAILFLGVTQSFFSPVLKRELGLRSVHEQCLSFHSLLELKGHCVNYDLDVHVKNKRDVWLALVTGARLSFR